MTSYLKFDPDGRCIGCESRSDDMMYTELKDDILAQRVLIVPDVDWNKYNHKTRKFWRDGNEIKERVKVPPPILPRQRMHAQPVIRWTRSDAPATRRWQARTLFRPGDVIDEGYVCERKGITGDAMPDFRGEVVWESIPPVTWQRSGGLADAWQASTLYFAGERVAAGGAVWVCARPGITRAVTQPDWDADEVDDKDYIELPPVDIGGKRITLMVGDNYVSPDGPLRLSQSSPGRFIIRIDMPEFYSDDVLISVEGR